MSQTINDNNKRIVKNTLYLYMRMFVMLAVSLFTARIVFNTLGVKDYGTFNVVAGIIVFFTFINTGLAGASKRYIIAELAKGSVESQRKVFTTTVIAHALIAAIIFIGGETIGLWFLNTQMNIPEGRMVAANFVYQFSILATMTSVMQSPYGSAIVAYEKMSIYSYFTILDVFFKLGIVYLVKVLPGDKLIIYGLLVLVVSLTNRIIYRVYCHRKFPMCHFVKVWDGKLLKNMFGYMGWQLLGQCSFLVCTQGLSIVINIIYDVTVNAAMAVSQTIVTKVTHFVSNFLVAMNPQLGKYYIRKEYKELNKLLVRASRYSAYLLIIFVVPIMFECEDLLTVWLGNVPKYSAEFCRLTFLCTYFKSINMPMIYVITADEDIKKYQLIVSSFYITCFFSGWGLLSLGFVPYIVIAIRLLSEIILVGVRLHLVDKMVENFPVKDWLYEVIVKTILIIVIPSILTYFLTKIEYGNIWIRVISVSTLSVTMCSALIYFKGLTDRERELLVTKFKEKVLRKA